MIKIKAIPFILITTVLHIAASIASSVKIADCDIQTNCVSAATRICSQILAFPLVLVSWFWRGGEGSVSSASYLYLLINSFLAATFVWLLVKPFLNWSGKQKD